MVGEWEILRFFGRKRNPHGELREQLDMQEEVEIESREAGDMDVGSVFGSLPFDARVLEDEKIVRNFFDHEGPFFNPVFLPLLPYVSRTLALTRMTEEEIRDFKQNVDLKLEQCVTMAKDRFTIAILESLADYIKWRITAARRGFLLGQLTEHRKTLRLIRGEEKKSRWRLW